MEPTKKNLEIDNLINSIFGIDRVKDIRSNVCVFCRKEIDENTFKDELSRKEYRISGMCQQCQDETFGR